MPKLNRFEWLKAVLQSRELTSSAKAVASALAVQFANNETGELNPSQETLVEYLGMSLATIKRCIRQLVELGWLLRTEGRGAGNYTEYGLRAPCKIIPFRRKKKGSSASLQNDKKRSSVTQKAFTGELSYMKEEQSTKQSAALEADRLEDGPSDPVRGYEPREVFVPRSSFGCRQWEAFSERMFGSWIERVFPVSSENGTPGYWLPDKFPPTNKAEWPALRDCLNAQGWTVFEQLERGHRHAV
ncbi:helix-turn-helix domain-containing protein [Roseobacteraceae bacterium NS-SX3]